MKIINQIKSSIYDKSFYEEVKITQIENAWKYFIKISLIQAVLLTIIVSFFIIPALNGIFSEESKTKISNYFPEELVFTLNKGKVSTNVQEPYVVPHSQFDGEDVEKNESRMTPRSINLIVIDTQASFSLELFESLNSDVLITSENLIIKESSGKITIHSLESFPDMSLSRAKIFEWITKAQPFFKFVIPVTILFYFVASIIGYFISHLIFLVITSFIVWLILKMLKKNLDYPQIFKQGLYVITSVLILEILLSIVGIAMPSTISFVIFMIVYFVNTNTKAKTEVKVVNQDQPSL